jgi:Ca2+-transporting ATPase
MVQADSIICDDHVVLSNEASLTGEPDDLKKSKEKDCFLLSSCLITEADECKSMVIGTGSHSQWGKIKANLVTEAVNTPLQDKLEDMTQKVIRRLLSLTAVLEALCDLCDLCDLCVS